MSMTQKKEEVVKELMNLGIEEKIGELVSKDFMPEEISVDFKSMVEMGIQEVYASDIMERMWKWEKEVKKEEIEVKVDRAMIPESIKGELKEKLRAIKKKISREKLEEILRRIEKIYEKSQVEPCEAAGIVAAQSIGEPGTQMTMRTFHYAGVGAIYVTLGLPRIIEIVDARKKPSTPVMKVRLERECAFDKNKAENVGIEIEEITISDIGKIEESTDDMIISVELDENVMEKKGLKKDEIIKKVKGKLDIDLECERNEIIVYPSYSSYRELLRLKEKISRMLVKGIEGIRRVLVRRDENGEYMLFTEGSSLKKVLRVEGVDPGRTTTNDINEIAEVLGIEAARNAIIEEMMSTLEEQGLDVDIRHIMLVADAMTMDGELKPIGRHGIAGKKASVLSRAAFEITVDNLLEAAMYGEVDNLRGVTENVIVGQPIKLGTGEIELVARRDGYCKGVS